MMAMLWVKEQHPLKQGLKLDVFGIRDAGNKVKEQHPLKQGLKQSINCIHLRLFYG